MASLFMNVNIENMIGPEVSFNVIPTQRRFYDQLDNPFIYFDNSKTNGHNIDNWYWEFGDGNYREGYINTLNIIFKFL